MSVQLTPELHEQYQLLWDSCEPHVSADATASRLIASTARYADVAALVNPLMPWHFVALVHEMEGGGNFERHLHNGDPLTARTVHVPVGRPTEGEPPFQWEASACDALRLQGLYRVSDWSIPGQLYQLEAYNGFGYRRHGINTPYLWSGTNHYTAGKFTADGTFDPSAVSKQIGAAVILKTLIAQPATA